MKKLELKHLAPYLPYNVKQMMLSDNIVGIMKAHHLLDLKHYWSKYGYMLLLHPLSNLTKPIKVEGCNDGKEFVPMIELLRLKESNFFHSDNRLKHNANLNIISCSYETYDLSIGLTHEAIVKYIETYTNQGDIVKSFRYDTEFRRFALRNDSHNKPLAVGYQLDLFKLLYQWHFDVENLIELGLAIDIDTLNKQQ
ncbi:hypothetical protein KAR91_25640 [Candidatus Pacearchaeota archaeon]|nr:hypothetical protein [Candidatus Pacearchaeota archaeon]